MSIVSKLAQIALYKRNKELDFASQNPVLVQNQQLKYLLSVAESTTYGKMFSVKGGDCYNSFAAKMPIVTYDSLLPMVERTMKGEQNLLWNSPIKWYAKSSGTTSTVSKYIPTSSQILERCHFRGTQDVAAYYYRLYPNGGCLDGKLLTLGGTLVANPYGGGGMAGDLSGILIDNQPLASSLKRTPSKSVALIADFEQKIELILKKCSTQNVTSFAGVPVWYMVLANKMVEYTGKANMCEVWPNIDFFAHGGTSFAPYREQFKALFPSENMKYMETYNASEGFFAIADDNSRDDMLLMLDYGIFYEFLETSLLSDSSKVVPLEGVECGKDYAVIISSCSGLWRYMIGDTVQFTSINPYRIKISGRTKHFINMAGEEVIIDNAQRAFEVACNESGAQVGEYTASPRYMNGTEKGAHQWVVEFDVAPKNLNQFVQIFDKALQSVNSDYAVKRTKDMVLTLPIFTIVEKGTFYNWLKSKGKLGGQNKVPRLSNNRDYIDQILASIDHP